MNRAANMIAGLLVFADGLVRIQARRRHSNYREVVRRVVSEHGSESGWPWPDVEGEETS